MKKIISAVVTAALGFSLCGCSGENADINEKTAFQSMCSYFMNDYAKSNTETIEFDDYYLQISKTQAEAHVMTEAVRSGEDCAFLEYDVVGGLKFFRNDKLKTVNMDTAYEEKNTDAKWDDFTYEKTAQTYKSVLTTLCSKDYSDTENNDLIKEITIEETESKDFPYKISAHFNLDTVNAKELFGSGGNFGSLSIKFLTDETGTHFDDIALYTQYDFNDEINVVSVKFGEANLPDNEGDNGQRPEDIEEEYNKNAAELKASFDQYLEELQQSIS